MIVSRFYEPAIAQASYLIGCAATGEAIVIDPTRDLRRYIDAAAAEGLRITHVSETHIHADYLSGSRELAQRTGARLFLSDEGDPSWKYAFASEGTLVRNGDRIEVGRIAVDVVATPGHTPEHIAFVVTDRAAADQPIAAATGDFVFVGDVGRPDLLERAANLEGTMEQGARTLWRSLQSFKARPEWLQIWPGHGAGSACGKGISAVPYSTVGYEQRFNWAFRAASEDEFVAGVLAGQPDPPRYFARMKRLNKDGPPVLGEPAAPPQLDGRVLADLLTRKATIVDTRDAEVYAAHHLRGTINLPLSKSFVTWAGWLLPYDTDLYAIVDDHASGDGLEIVRQLALIGLDRVAGVFDATALTTAVGYGAPTGTIPQVSPRELAGRVASRAVTVLDVRHDTEWAHGHVEGAVHVPLGHLEERLAEVPRDRPVVVHCQGGTRSAIATSVLERAGLTDVSNLVGGLSAWSAAGLSLHS